MLAIGGIIVITFVHLKAHQSNNNTKCTSPFFGKLLPGVCRFFCTADSYFAVYAQLDAHGAVCYIYIVENMPV